MKSPGAAATAVYLQTSMPDGPTATPMRPTAVGQTLPIPALGEHIHSASVSCRNRCGATNGELVPPKTGYAPRRACPEVRAIINGVGPAGIGGFAKRGRR
jgi:hypothetical protein